MNVTLIGLKESNGGQVAYAGTEETCTFEAGTVSMQTFNTRQSNLNSRLGRRPIRDLTIVELRQYTRR